MILVLSGDGLNCEQETRAACVAMGLDAEIRHLNDLIESRFSQKRLCDEVDAVIIPGGFSFGDEWDSGRVLALKIQDHLGWDLREYAIRGGWVLGICNGFQALIRLGVFGRAISITHNASGKFQNRWAKMHVKEPQAWLEGVKELDLPIRHGEGRIVTPTADWSGSRSEIRLAIQYDEDVNGSLDRAAALSTAEGRILGMMPHPEAAFHRYQVPGWSTDPASAFVRGPGAALFKNLRDHLKGKLR